MGQCIGIIGNLKTGVRRCRRDAANRFFCHQHRRQPFWWALTILFVAGSIASIITLFLSDSHPQKTLTQLNPDPIIKCKLEHPLVVEDSIPVINKRNPDVIIYNDGAVGAVSLKVDLWIYTFDISESKITSSANFGWSPHNHLFAIDEFKPSDSRKQSLPGIHGPNQIGIYVFDLSYHRDGDLKEYKRQEQFFIENEVIYTDGEFSSRKEYEEIVQELRNFMTVKDSLPKTCLRGTDQHAWVLDAHPKHDVRPTEDGSVTIRLKFDKLESLKSHYASIKRPYLNIKPVKFKDTVTYLKGKVEGNTATVSFLYEVTNEGDETALDVEDLRSPTAKPEPITILPGQKKYLTKNILLKRKVDDLRRDKDDSLATLDLEKISLIVQQSILYSCKKQKGRRYLTAVRHEFKEDNVKLILSEYE